MSRLLHATFMTAFSLVAVIQPVSADTTSADIHKISASGVGEKIGTLELADSEQGLVFTVKVTGLPAGEHGFHVHEKGNCGPGEKDGRVEAGIAAGPHFDPVGAKSHKGPIGQGHKGDLPVLKLEGDDGEKVLIAPKLGLSEVRGRAVVIHEGGDTYADTPELGGGKGRIACGVIP